MNSTRFADCVVFGTCLLVIPFLFGMGAGCEQARKEIATVCEPQPGATLAATYQDKAGVMCSYIDSPPIAMPRRKQKATKA